MRIDKKISAMTINEMLVVIIVSTIVIGMAFSVLRMVQKHMWSIQKHISANTTTVRLEQSLWVDFNRYNSISYDAAESTLVFKSEIDSVTYKFIEESVIKARDTFKLDVKSKHPFFNGNAITSGAIDAIKLYIGKPEREKSLFIYKRKAANQFMK